MAPARQFDFSKKTIPAPVPTARGPGQQRNTPVASWRSGGLQVSIWENDAVDETGAISQYRTVSFDRRYKDKNGEWKSTNSLRTNDLPKATLLLQKAYEYLTINGEHDEN